MKVILKQFFKTILKKSFLMIAFLASFFVVVTTASIGAFIISSVVNSNNEINQKGNSSNIIFDNVNPDLNIVYNSPNSASSYFPEITNQTYAFNLNGVDPKVDQLIVFPIAPEDYFRLNDRQVTPNWSQTAANNQNFLSTNPEYFNSPFISQNAGLMFIENAVRSYLLSFDENPDPNEINMSVFLDPRWFNFKENEYNNKVVIDGFYNNFTLNHSGTLLESTMVVDNLDLPFNPKSLRGENIRRSGIYRKQESIQDFRNFNDQWNHNIERFATLNNFFSNMPNIAKENPDPMPELNSGVPYIEKQDAIEIKLNLDINRVNPLVKLYLNELEESKRNDWVNKTVLMTPFQVSESQYETIPTKPSELNNFKNSMTKYILNLSNYHTEQLAKEVDQFKQDLIYSTLENYDWNVSEDVVLSFEEKTYLFSTREMNEINNVVIQAGQNIFKNEIDIEQLKQINEVKNNNKTFNSEYEYLKFISGFEEKFDPITNKPLYSSVINDANENIYGALPYPESITPENPNGVIPTRKERRLIKDILEDVLLEFYKIDKDPNLNQLSTFQIENLTTEQQQNLIDQGKIKEITKKPIYFEYRSTIRSDQLDYRPQTKLHTYTSSFNHKSSFLAEESFTISDATTSWLSRPNFENFGVVVSSNHFNLNNLKIFDDEMIVEAKQIVEENLRKNPTSDVDKIVDDYLATIPDEYKISIQNRTFYILGAGDAPDFRAPIIDSTRPLPNPRKEAVIYTNATQLGSIKGLMGNLNDKVINIKAPSASFWGIDNHIKAINRDLNQIFGKAQINSPFVIYPNVDNFNNPNINTFRWQFPDLVIGLFTTIILVIIIILLIIVIYILSMIIKFLFDTLSFSIAIARANGIPRRKIILSLAIILGGFALILTAIVFIASYFVTPLAFPIIVQFWFVPLNLVTFPWYGIPLILLCATILLGTIIFFISWKSTKKPILQTLSGNDIVKTNKLSKIIRSNKILLRPLAKLRISMISSKMGKISLISSLTGLSFGISTGTISLTQKIDEAKINHSQTKDYFYAFDYEQPNSNTGLLKPIPASNLGEINPRAGVHSILVKAPEGEINRNPYYSLLYDANDKVINNSLLAKRIVERNTSEDNTTFPITAPIAYSNDVNYEHIPGDSNSTFRTYENFILPSMDTFANYFYGEPNLTFNGVFLVDLLDIDLGTFIGVEVGNLWEMHIAKELPYSMRFSLESAVAKYREAIYSKYPWYGNFLKLEDPKKPFNINDNPPIKPLTVDADIVFDMNQVRLKDNFLEALGVFLGDDELTSMNVAANYNYSSHEIEDETYTYVNADANLQKKSKSIKLMGIQENSKYINLTSSKNESLNYLINENSNKVIINEGAAYANNLRIGSKIPIKVQNDYYGRLKNLLESSSSKINFNDKEVVLEVVGISQDSVGQTFWINQSFANELTNMKDGDYVKQLYSVPRNGIYVERQPFTPVYDVENPNKLAINEPFNGVFTKSENPKLMANSLPLTSYGGLYPLNFDYRYIRSFLRPNDLYNMFVEIFDVPYDPNNVAVMEIYNEIQDVQQTKNMQEFLKYSFENTNIFINKIEESISPVTITPNLVGLDGVIINDQIFELVGNTSSTLSIVIIVVFVPLLLLTILVSMLSLADDFRKSLSMLRILGMNKRKTIGSVILMYLPIIVLGITSGLLFGFLINLFFQSIIFTSLSVFITSVLNFAIYGISIAIMLGLMGITLLIVMIILLREKLEKTIKF